MVVLYIFLVLLVIVASILLFIFLVTGLYEDYIIRINEANISIESVLNKKFDLLKKANDIIKEIKESEEDIIDNLEKIHSQKLNNIEFNKELDSAIIKFRSYEEELDIKDNKEYNDIGIELNEIETECTALKQYYNDVSDKYNNMLTFAPYKLVAKIKKYEKLEQFDKIEEEKA